MKSYKAKEIIKMLLADGWYLKSQKGSHRHFKHPTKPGKVTVPGKLSKTLDEGTSFSIHKQAGWL